jgi:hypothetical protein
LAPQPSRAVQVGPTRVELKPNQGSKQVWGPGPGS